jgi:hypothetical protein
MSRIVTPKRPATSFAAAAPGTAGHRAVRRAMTCACYADGVAAQDQRAP